MMDITSARLQYTAISEGGAKQDGSDFLGAGSSDPSPPTGDGAAMSHSTPLEGRNHPRPAPGLQLGEGEYQSPPEPVGPAHSGSGAEPQRSRRPPLLTGGQKAVEGVAVGVDWCSVTFPGDLDRVMLMVSLALGCEVGDWVELEHGSYGYRQGMVGPGGARVWWDPPGREDVHASLPGKACVIAGEVRLRKYLLQVLAVGGKATRVDVAIDDYDRVVVPADVLEALQGPDKVTHARQYLTQQGGRVGSPELTGATVYLGAPSSRQRLRVYDKGLESGGQMDCVRWELESHKEAAETMAVALAHQDWGQLAASRLVGFVDFRDRSSHSEVERRWRLPWFEALVGLVRKASAYLPQAPRTVEEVVDWLDRAIGPSLAVAMTFWKGDLGPLSAIIRDGQLRWKPKHKAMLAMVAVASG